MDKTYSFESSDSLAQFSAWLWHIYLTFFGILAAFGLSGWRVGVACLMLCVVHVAGLRASITVKPAEVVVVKKWLFIPYKVHRAQGITDVWYGGDWGLEEGAICLVVKLGDEEVTIGTSKNMSDLYADLSPHITSKQTMGAAA